jgi:osmotically inducible protein OsmC
MAPSATLARKAKPPDKLEVKAICSFDKLRDGWRVTTSELSVRGKVLGLAKAEFEGLASEAESTCPISNAIHNNVEISLSATLD